MKAKQKFKIVGQIDLSKINPESNGFEKEYLQEEIEDRDDMYDPLWEDIYDDFEEPINKEDSRSDKDSYRILDYHISEEIMSSGFFYPLSSCRSVDPLGAFD